MKLKMNRISKGEEEVIIQYREMNEQIEAIAAMVQGAGQRLAAIDGDQTILLLPENILYAESVDGVTYVYLADKVCRVQEGLSELIQRFTSRGFFRCSRTMVINIFKITFLKSEPGNRICATMENNERVMISRKYAKQLRQILKGGMESEDE